MNEIVLQSYTTILTRPPDRSETMTLEEMQNHMKIMDEYIVKLEKMLRIRNADDTLNSSISLKYVVDSFWGGQFGI